MLSGQSRPQSVDRACLSPIGSVTQAMHAKEILGQNGISVTVVRNDPSTTKHGCAYAISYPCEQERTIRGILRKAGFRWHGGVR